MNLKIGTVPLGQTPKIVASFGDKTSPALLRKLKRRGLQIAELRIDLFHSQAPSYVLKELEKFKSVATIATLRTRSEGGRWPHSESYRFLLFTAVVPQVDAVDIELSSTQVNRAVIQLAKRMGKLIIVSCHDFKKTPREPALLEIVRRARRLGADVVKIAAFAWNHRDFEQLRGFTAKHAGKNLVTIAMGRQGTASRILFPAVGSLLTYTYVGRSVAPGQLNFNSTLEVFKTLYPR